MGVKLGES